MGKWPGLLSHMLCVISITCLWIHRPEGAEVHTYSDRKINTQVRNTKGNWWSVSPWPLTLHFVNIWFTSEIRIWRIYSPGTAKIKADPKGVCRVTENNHYTKNNNYNMTGKETGYNRIRNYRRQEIIQGCNIMRVQYQERLEGERNKTGHEVLYTLLSFQ